MYIFSEMSCLYNVLSSFLQKRDLIFLLTKFMKIQYSHLKRKKECYVDRNQFIYTEHWNSIPIQFFFIQRQCMLDINAKSALWPSFAKCFCVLKKPQENPNIPRILFSVL